MKRRILSTLMAPLLALSLLLLSGCDVDLYSELPEGEANQMLALLMLNHIEAQKKLDKSGRTTLRVSKSAFVRAVEILRQNGFPKPKYVSVIDVFPSNQLVSSPEQERAKIEYLKEQQLQEMLMSIDGVIEARVVMAITTPEHIGADEGPSTASVLVKYSPAVNLPASQEQIRGLVTSALPKVKPEFVSVVLLPASYRYIAAQNPQFSATMNKWWAWMLQNPLILGTIAILIFTLILVALGISLVNTKRQR